MTLAYRGGSFVSAGNIAGPDLTLTKPTGTANGDVVFILVYFEPDTCAISISPGTWESLEIANPAAHKMKAFWKYASSEPASYTISNDVVGDQWRIAAGVAYSGGTGSGTIKDVSGTAQADGVILGLQTAPSVTTLVANDMLVFGYSNSSSTNVGSTTGAATNLRGSFGGVTIADAVIASPSATGTSAPNSGPGTENYAAMHVALISDTGSGASVVISAAGATWDFPHPPIRTA